jgi:hypothetical protein
MSARVGYDATMRRPARPLVLLAVLAPLLAPGRASAQEPPPPPPPAAPAPPPDLPQVPPDAAPPAIPPAPPAAPPSWQVANPYPSSPPPVPLYPQPGYTPSREIASPAPPPAERAGAANWYGWQTLIAIAPFDIAMFAGLATWGQSSGYDAFTVGFVGRNLAPSVVHMAHQRFGIAFGSIGLHIGASATGLAIAYAFGIAFQAPCQPLNPCKNQFQSIPSGVGYGVVVGSMVGTVLDVVFLGYRQKLAWTASAAPPERPRVAWTVAPYLAPPPGGQSASPGSFARAPLGLAAVGTF